MPPEIDAWSFERRPYAEWPNARIPRTPSEALLALAVFARTAPGSVPECVTASLAIADSLAASRAALAKQFFATPFMAQVSLGNESGDASFSFRDATVAIYSEKDYEDIDEDGEDWDPPPLKLFSLFDSRDLRMLADLLDEHADKFMG